MRKENGILPKALRCINARKDKWAIVWGGEPCEDSDNFDYMEEVFDHKPTLQEIHATIDAYYNGLVDEKIATGYEWHGTPVYLSMENQINFKAAHDLCVQNGSVLGGALKFKLSEDENGVPVYYTFTELAELGEFYSGAVAFNNTCLNEGWAKKDSVDWKQYKDDKHE